MNGLLPAPTVSAVNTADVLGRGVRHILSATSVWDGSDPLSARHLTFCGLRVRYPSQPHEYERFSSYGTHVLVACADCLADHHRRYPANRVYSVTEIGLIRARECVWRTEFTDPPGVTYCRIPVTGLDPFCGGHLDEYRAQLDRFDSWLNSGAPINGEPPPPVAYLGTPDSRPVDGQP